jgi:hypothetical protein
MPGLIWSMGKYGAAAGSVTTNSARLAERARKSLFMDLLNFGTNLDRFKEFLILSESLETDAAHHPRERVDFWMVVLRLY